MGGTITIGFVYEAIDSILTELTKIVTCLMTKKGQIEKLTFSTDENGDNWVEIIDTNQKLNDQLLKLSQGHYGQLNFSSLHLGNFSLDVQLRIVRRNSHFGFLMDLSDEAVSADKLKDLEDSVFEFMKDVMMVSRFSYTFCDHEAELEFSPEDFYCNGKNSYSMAAYSPIQSSELVLHRSGWMIDGITKRKLDVC